MSNTKNFTLEHTMMYQRRVKKIMSTPKIQLSAVAKDKIYPIINNVAGAQVGLDFLRGLENDGLGKIQEKSFKRYHPDDADCIDKENLRKRC
jgi:hypothetical protein